MTGQQKLAGRRTKDEEINLYLEGLGLNRAVLEATGEAMLIEREERDGLPETIAELRDRALASLSRDLDSLSGVAKVQAVRVIQQLAREEPDDGKGETEPLIADVIAGIHNLSIERRHEILEGELVKLDVERAAILGVLNA